MVISSKMRRMHDTQRVNWIKKEVLYVENGLETLKEEL